MIVSPILFELIARFASEYFIRINDCDGSLIFHEFDLDEMELAVSDSIICTEEEHQFIRELTWDTVLSPEVRTLVVRNNPNNNKGLVIFEKMTPSGITVRDIAEGITRVTDYPNERMFGFLEASIIDGHATYVPKLIDVFA